MSRILVSMPEGFLNSIDRLAFEEHRSRSELIREALRTYMNKQNLINKAIAKKNADILEDLIG